MQIWNPVKAKMLAGGKITGGTVFAATDPSTYCAKANAGYDYIWTEMQHDAHDDWSFFPHACETANIARGVAAELGALANTQGKVSHVPAGRFTGAARPSITEKSAGCAIGHLSGNGAR